MKKIILDLYISADEWQKLYRGSSRIVSAKSRDGKNVKFPVNIIQNYLTRSGVSGSFEIYFDDNGKFQRITRL